MTNDISIDFKCNAKVVDVGVFELAPHCVGDGQTLQFEVDRKILIAKCKHMPKNPVVGFALCEVEK